MIVGQRARRDRVEIDDGTGRTEPRITARLHSGARSMKVVSVMTSDARGGGEFSAVNMLEALSRRGHAAVLLTNQPSLATHRPVAARAIDLGPKLSRASVRTLASRWPLLLARLRRELEREWPYDVLIMHFKKEQLLSAMLPQRLRPKLLWPEWGPIPQPMRSGLGRWVYATAARRADVILAVSAGTRDSVREAGIADERVHVVPNALSVDELAFSDGDRTRIRAELGIPREALVVGCVSRFHRLKRNDVAVDAVVALGRDDLHLIMAGEGDAEADLRRRARPLGERAHFIPTPGTEIAAVCSAFDISLFCPSPTEGAPLAVIHSMLASRPCVASAGEGVAGLIVPGAGTIVSPENDVSAVAETLRRYLDDDDRRTNEGAAAQTLAKCRFAAPLVAERIEQLISR